MEKKFITEADNVQDEWYVQAREQKMDTLPTFLNHMLNDYSHDAKTIVHAVTAGSLATIAAMNSHPEGDLGPTQTSGLLGLFIRKWARIEGPAKIMSWAGLLDPRNEPHVMVVPKDVVAFLSDMATKGLALGKFNDAEHKEHLEKLAKGEMPWGFRAQ